MTEEKEHFFGYEPGLEFLPSVLLPEALWEKV